ncbi:MAG: carboxypeptidase M32 [Janthinobacterium lividum]
MQEIERLQSHLSEIKALTEAAAVLNWDQLTYMPPGGAESRAAQLTVLSQVIHEKATSRETAGLLESAALVVENADPDSDEAALVRAARRDFDQATKVPTALVAEMTRVTSLAHAHWAEARAASDWSRFAPWLKQILELTRSVADHLGHGGERYDALLDQYEPGMTTVEVRTLFEALKPTLVTLVQSVAAKGPDAVDDSVLKRNYDEAAQEQFGKTVIKALGYDLIRGRQDRALHPFCTSFGSDDVRITTRFDRNFLPMALFGSIHETGHALYEQGLAKRFTGGGLGEPASLGFHESQSRLWENLVGRSRPFWQHFYPALQSTFPDTLNAVSQGDFYRAINKVEPSLIRVEADEVTYNLHILLRFEMEIDLLSGALSVADSPAAWNAKMQQYFGLTPPDDAQGILQDVHWSSGALGYFPTYTVGNVLSVQLFDKANTDLGGQVAAQIASGDFAPLLGWLRENVHQWGRKYLPNALVRRAVGSPLDPAPYLKYLSTKFGEVYGIE